MGGFYTPEHSEAIGLERHGRLVAGIIYEDWNRTSVVCHIAIRGRITPEWLFAISEYAYIALGVHKIIAPCYTDNVRAMRILPKMGFIEEGRLKDAQPNGDVILFTMTKEQCKYLGDRYNGQKRHAAALA